MSVKRLRILLSDRTLDNWLLFITPGERLMLGPNKMAIKLEIDVQAEEMVARETLMAPNAQGELMQIEAKDVGAEEAEDETT